MLKYLDFFQIVFLPPTTKNGISTGNETLKIPGIKIYRYMGGTSNSVAKHIC